MTDASRGSSGIRLKRAYDPVEPGDGARVLVDRLWPRGVRKDGSRIDRWMRDVAPSDALRRWFGHDPDRWETFRVRYLQELEEKGDLVEALRNRAREGTLTLLYAARDVEHNHAVVLKDVLERER